MAKTVRKLLAFVEEVENKFGKIGSPKWKIILEVLGDIYYLRKGFQGFSRNEWGWGGGESVH